MQQQSDYNVSNCRFLPLDNFSEMGKIAVAGRGDNYEFLASCSPEEIIADDEGDDRPLASLRQSCDRRAAATMMAAESTTERQTRTKVRVKNYWTPPTKKPRQQQVASLPRHTRRCRG